MVAALVAAAHKRLHLYVTAHLEQADDARDDLELFLGRACELFPAWETLPGEGAASGEIEAERLRLCSRLQGSTGFGKCGDPAACSSSTMIVTPIQALMQPVPDPEMLRHNTLQVFRGTGGEATSAGSPESVVAWAIDRGFQRLELVESPGDVAQRGDIVDLFVPGETNPVRIQFLGNEVESIRRFDVSTQRSIETLTSLSVAAIPDDKEMDSAALTDLTAYLPSDTMLILDGPSEIQTMGEMLQARLGASNRTYDVTEVLARAGRFPQLYLSSFGSPTPNKEDEFDMGVTSVSRFESNAADAVADLCRVARDHEVHVICDTEGERRRLI